MVNVSAFLYFFIPVLIVFIIESVITYRGLCKFYEINPVRWLPPGWLFGVVWIVLFILMTIGGYLYYVSQSNEDKRINFLSAFYVQLLLNFIWVVVFFGSPSLMGGRFGLLILFFLILINIYLIVEAASVNLWIMSFFIVYIAWLVFAMCLNIAFVTGLSSCQRC